MYLISTNSMFGWFLCVNMKINISVQIAKERQCVWEIGMEPFANTISLKGNDGKEIKEL